MDGGISMSKREIIQKKEDTNQTDSISRSGETAYDLFMIKEEFCHVKQMQTVTCEHVKL